MKQQLFFRQIIFLYLFSLSIFLFGQNNTWQPLGPDDSSQPSFGTSDVTSLTMAPNGTLYFGYRDYVNNSKATVKKFNGTNWETVGTEGFSDGIISQIDLTTAPDGTPYIAYQDYANGSKLTVKKIQWYQLGNSRNTRIYEQWSHFYQFSYCP
ncbi:hypothetical protein [Chryseobacterium proteolyticum]|uniref:hypothetical protein n=1 Tax=Chryseobacterium proteolyticum TaxID=118127 RepID=UPI00398369B7